MVTVNQIIFKKNKRLRKRHVKRTTALKGNPQKRGTCLKVFTESPKKPNSAKRRVAKIRLCTGKTIRAQVPGEGAGNVQKHCRVLIRGGHTRDLPGIRYRVVRGKLDSHPVFERKKARSKYGVKRKKDLTKFFS